MVLICLPECKISSFSFDYFYINRFVEHLTSFLVFPIFHLQHYFSTSLYLITQRYKYTMCTSCYQCCTYKLLVYNRFLCLRSSTLIRIICPRCACSRTLYIYNCNGIFISVTVVSESRRIFVLVFLESFLHFIGVNLLLKSEDTDYPIRSLVYRPNHNESGTALI